MSIDVTLAAAEARFAAVNPLSRARHQRARRVLPGGHSRQTLLYPPFPVTIARGSGATLEDLDGHRYLNLVGDYAAGVYGHTSPEIRRAVEQALADGVFLSGVNTKEVELAELIGTRIPSMQQIRFCNSGSEACLYAAQLARHATGRPSLFVFEGCYHGGFMIWGPSDPPLTVPFGVVKGRYNDLDGTRTLLRAHRGRLAAVFVEPMMGSGGCIPGDEAFLAMLREETAQAGIVLVFDEVMTSRLGPGGMQGRLGIAPDLTTLGKFWGGGFSFGAFGGTPELMRHFDTSAGGTLSQAGTFNNNIVAMSAGLAGARDVYTPEACERLNAAGDRLRSALNELARELGVAMQVSGVGATMNVHWHRRPIRHPGDVEPYNSARRRLFQLEMLLAGYYVAMRGMINLSLPMTEADIDGFRAAVRAYLLRHRELLRGEDL
jgi:glutamate-1-semialdehyde 2,1-aminomutase